MPPKAPKTPKEEAPSCDICCAQYNKSTRKEIKCDFCSKNACLECIKHFLLDTIGDNYCMFCKNKWNRDVLVDKLPQKFIKEDLRKSQENMIVDIEKARLPEAQTLAERRIKQKMLIQFREAATSLAAQFGENESQSDLLKLIAKNYGILDHINVDADILDILHTLDTQEVKVEERNYIRPCPNSECRGYVNKDWKCGLCNSQLCSKCYEILEDDEFLDDLDDNKDKSKHKHKCDGDIIKSNRLIAKDSRPCPKCNALITKLSGCDMMFCTYCKTGFSWNNGTILKGNFHNPHYIEWQMKVKGKGVTPELGAPVDMCADNYFPDFSKLAAFSDRFDNYCNKWVPRFHQYINHMYSVNRPVYLQTVGRDEKMDINVNYLMTAIGKTEWKRQLYESDTKEAMARDVLDLMEMAYTTASERFRMFISDMTKNKPGFKQYIEDIQKLVIYTSEEADKIRKRYMIKNVIITEPEWFSELKSVKNI